MKRPDAKGRGGGKLAEYRAKRSAGRTPEPFGGGDPGGGTLQFVVQKHWASHLHYDFRLEWGGVLLSWAVPKGPSPDPADKRLAMQVEDHPLEYADFEGIIPEGNYGAGAVIVWDRGTWTPLNDIDAGLTSGKLLFELHGFKLHGKWTLVKVKRGPKEWLLIKERDGYVRAGEAAHLAQESVVSGLTVEELREGRNPAGELETALETSGAPSRSLRAGDVEVMLAETRKEPFNREGWLFEPKLDGYRIIAGKQKGQVTLLSRNRNDLTATFPEVARAVSRLPVDSLVLDGEVVIPDQRGVPSFQALQKRGGLNRASDVARMARELPAQYYVFDLPAALGRDLRSLPLLERKRLLRRIIPPSGLLRYTEHFESDGELVYQQARQMGFEGIVAKRATSPYRNGRSGDWIKVRADHTGDFVVVGYTRPRGGRTGFGALQLAAWDGNRLVYVGRVGTGFSDAQLEQAGSLMEETSRPAPPCDNAPADRTTTWVEPAAVVEVRYREWTDQGLLRHPVFLRFRPDKNPEECPLPPEPGAPASAPAPRPARTEPAPPVREVNFTNLDKVFWPEEGYTKGDLVDYYRRVAPALLPYLRDRPVVLTRFPDGIHGKSFFQKDAPAFAPSWVRTETIWSGGSERELRYFICNDLETLLYLANMGTIPLHVWASRLGSLEQPDWCILDLDPKEAPFIHVVRVAQALHRLCGEIGLPHYVKTSGSTGLHVLLPLGRQFTFDQCRSLGELLARVIVAELPEIATIVRRPGARGGKVYLDFLQNGHGKLLVAPYSVRPRPGATVSAPLDWREVNARLSIDRFTIRSMPQRLKRKRKDPLLPVLTEVPDVAGALEKLMERARRAQT